MSKQREEQGQKEPKVNRKWTDEEWEVICHARAMGFTFFTGGAKCAL